MKKFDIKLQDLIKNLPYTRFHEESKTWMVPRNRKMEVCEVIGEFCVKNKFKVVDIPPFVETILNSKMPFQCTTKLAK